MFSGAVKIGDLNDFIAPSQACVVSLEGGKFAGAPVDAEVRQSDFELAPGLMPRPWGDHGVSRSPNCGCSKCCSATFRSAAAT